MATGVPLAKEPRCQPYDIKKLILKRASKRGLQVKTKRYACDQKLGAGRAWGAFFFRRVLHAGGRPAAQRPPTQDEPKAHLDMGGPTGAQARRFIVLRSGADGFCLIAKNDGAGVETL